jgi:hypothetical protein
VTARYDNLSQSTQSLSLADEKRAAPVVSCLCICICVFVYLYLLYLCQGVLVSGTAMCDTLI